MILIVSMAHCLSYSQQSDLDIFNTKREKIDKDALKVLGAYSAANVIYGSIAASRAANDDKYFHQMNAIWNGVTLGIAGIGYLSKKKQTNRSYIASARKQHSTEKLFLLNAGLDLAYFAAGAYMQERSKTSTKNAARLKGYGRSVMLQGAVLLVFDAALYGVHQHHGKKLGAIGSRLQLAATANGIGLQVSL